MQDIATAKVLVDTVWDFYQANKKKPTVVLLHPAQRALVERTYYSNQSQNIHGIDYDHSQMAFIILGVPVKFTPEVAEGTVTPKFD